MAPAPAYTLACTIASTYSIELCARDRGPRKCKWHAGLFPETPTRVKTGQKHPRGNRRRTSWCRSTLCLVCLGYVKFYRVASVHQCLAVAVQNDTNGTIPSALRWRCEPRRFWASLRPCRGMHEPHLRLPTGSLFVAVLEGFERCRSKLLLSSSKAIEPFPNSCTPHARLIDRCTGRPPLQLSPPPHAVARAQLSPIIEPTFEYQDAATRIECSPLAGALHW